MIGRRAFRLPREQREGLYAGTPDPWGFVTSGLERRKYDAALEAIGAGHGNALEMGCSTGVFTRHLAPLCRQLLAADTSDVALEAARRRSGDLANVDFRQIGFPEDLPPDRFDLIVLAEAGFYWQEADLDLFAQWLGDALTPDGQVLLVHWTGGTDYPLPGPAVHDRLIAHTADQLRRTHESRDECFHMDLLAGRARRLA